MRIKRKKIQGSAVLHYSRNKNIARGRMIDTRGACPLPPATCARYSAHVKLCTSSQVGIILPVMESAPAPEIDSILCQG